MQMYNGIGLRDSLEQLETAKLGALLARELEKETPDPDAVRLIGSILQERQDAEPEPITPREEEAWQRYQARMEGLRRKRNPVRRRIAAAASLAVIAGLLFAVVPQQAEAGSFWQMLQRWTASILRISNPEDTISSMDYAFSSDNPGLQQIQDTAVEWGVTGPMIPMWFPEESVLDDFKTVITPMSKGLGTRFTWDGGEIVFKLAVYEGKPAREFYRDDSYEESYEKNGISFDIMRNSTRWVAAWHKDNIECSITLDCQEETLRRILGSIFVTED